MILTTILFLMSQCPKQAHRCTQKSGCRRVWCTRENALNIGTFHLDRSFSCSYTRRKSRTRLRLRQFESRESHTRMVMTEEYLIQDTRVLAALESPERAELQDQLLRLGELQYLSRCGDYMKILATRLRAHASKHKSEN